MHPEIHKFIQDANKGRITITTPRVSDYLQRGHETALQKVYVFT